MPSQTKAKRVVVAINPSASFGAKVSVGQTVVDGLTAAGHDVLDLRESSFADLVAASRAAVETSPDAFVVVGGDGMVNLGANTCAGTGVPLGLVPSGTGNDMARTLGIPHDNTEAAIAALLVALDKAPRTIDAGRMTWNDSETGEPQERWFACMVSAGIDALANERANKMHHPKGARRYILALVIELLKIKPIEYKLTLDGEVIETEACLVAVGNGVSLGGGMKLTPDAKVNDGLLDVAIVQPLGRIAFLRLFPKVYDGKHTRDPRVSIQRARRVRIEAKGVVAYGDGERVTPLPLDIEVVPAALQMLA